MKGNRAPSDGTSRDDSEPSNAIVGGRFASEITAGFFQAPPSTALIEDAILAIAAAKGDGSSLRIWVPACGTGEEAYTVAMLLHEARQAANHPFSIQVFATDFSQTAIETARVAKYSKDKLHAVSPKRVERFFERSTGGFQITRQLRDTVVFSPHDLTHDPPFSRIDLVVARNLRVDAGLGVDDQLSALFHYALTRSGFLLLDPGQSWPNLNWFRRDSSGVFQRIDVASTVIPLRARAANGGAVAQQANALAQAARLAIERAVLENYCPACVVIDDENRVVRLFGSAREFLEPPLGEPTTDLFEMARTELRKELQSFVREAKLGGGERFTQVLELSSGFEARRFCVQLERLPGTTPADGLWILLFEPDRRSSQVHELDPRGKRSRASFERLERELERTREDFQQAQREIREISVRYAASTEELMSSNEELQATNEELESTKEMLQVSNGELEQVNSELQTQLQRIARSSNDLRNLLENTRIATVFLDRELKIRWFTPATRELFNFIEKDLGRPIGDIAPRFEYERLAADADRVLQTSTTCEAQIELRNRQWFMMRILPYRAASGATEGVVMTFTDIWAVKSVELEVERLRQELEAQVRRLNALIDLVPVGIGFHEEGQQVIRVNRAAAELLDQSAGPVSRRTADALAYDWSPEGEPSLDPLWRAMTAHDRRHAEEIELAVGDDGHRHLVVHSTPLHGTRGEVYAQVSAVVDVTEHKHAILRATERERQQALIAEIGLSALENGDFQDFARRCLESISQAVGADLAEISELDAKRGQLRLIAGVNFRNDWQRTDPELLLPAGISDEWMRARSEPVTEAAPLPGYLRNENAVTAARVAIWAAYGEPFGVLGVYRRDFRAFSRQDLLFLRTMAHVFTTAIQRRTIDDARTRERESAARAASQEQLRRAERLISLGTFAAGVAHEVNNPLTNIGLAAEYAQKTENPERRAAMLATIVQNTKRCGRIVESVLSFARDETSRRWPNEINDIIRHGTELLRSTVGPDRLHVAYELEEPSPRVECNPTELEQVVINLMKNSVEAKESRCHVVLRSRRAAGKVLVTIIDDGPGIPVQDRQQIFDPFFSKRRGSGGTGLGLSISHRIVTLHGGSISVTDAPEHGAKFELEFPESQPSKEQ